MMVQGCFGVGSTVDTFVLGAQVKHQGLHTIGPEITNDTMHFEMGAGIRELRDGCPIIQPECLKEGVTKGVGPDLIERERRILQVSKCEWKGMPHASVTLNMSFECFPGGKGNVAVFACRLASLLHDGFLTVTLVHMGVLGGKVSPVVGKSSA